MSTLAQDVQELILTAEREVANEQDSRAVKQQFFGGIRVDPDHVFVGISRGEQAIRALDQFLSNKLNNG